MKNMCIGDKLQIQCYKHNGHIHRAWDEAVVLDVKKEYIVFGNNKTLVTEAEGNAWKTKEPAIMYYYCNIASPFIIEEETIKYIDYDLDLRIFPTGEYKILDRLEYKRHQKLMNYSNELSSVVETALEHLISLYNKKAIFFDHNKNYEYYTQYKSIKNEEK